MEHYVVSNPFLLYLESGFVTDEDVKRRELKLRDALKGDRQFRVKEGASVEVAQVSQVAQVCD